MSSPPGTRARLTTIAAALALAAALAPGCKGEVGDGSDPAPEETASGTESTAAATDEATPAPGDGPPGDEQIPLPPDHPVVGGVAPPSAAGPGMAHPPMVPEAEPEPEPEPSEPQPAPIELGDACSEAAEGCTIVVGAFTENAQCAVICPKQARIEKLWGVTIELFSADGASVGTEQVAFGRGDFGVENTAPGEDGQAPPRVRYAAIADGDRSILVATGSVQSYFESTHGRGGVVGTACERDVSEQGAALMVWDGAAWEFVGTIPLGLKATLSSGCGDAEPFQLEQLVAAGCAEQLLPDLPAPNILGDEEAEAEAHDALVATVPECDLSVVTGGGSVGEDAELRTVQTGDGSTVIFALRENGEITGYRSQGGKLTPLEAGAVPCAGTLDETTDADGNRTLACMNGAGQKHGLFRTWAANGQLIEAADFRNDKRVGWYRKWYVDGTPQLAGQYTAAGVGEGRWIVWWPNGQERKREYFAAGDRDGAFVSYYENGMLSRVSTYKAGRDHGLILVWEADGTQSARRLECDDKEQTCEPGARCVCP